MSYFVVTFTSASSGCLCVEESVDWNVICKLVCQLVLNQIDFKLESFNSAESSRM